MNMSVITNASRVSGAMLAHQGGQITMVDEVLGAGDDASYRDASIDYHESTDAVGRAGAIIRALQADGRITTPEEIGWLAFMLRRVMAAERSGAVAPSESQDTPTDPATSGTM